jgi:hypothetical protein
LLLTAGIHTIVQKNMGKVERSIMKKFKALSVPGLIVVMCLSLFAQQPQGGGGQAARWPLADGFLS